MLMIEVLECAFTCAVCGIVEAAVFIPLRRPEQPIEDWMQNVCVPCIMREHAMISPDCAATEITTIKIPISTDGIGYRLTGMEALPE